MDGTKPCVLYIDLLYCCPSHWSLVVRIVIRCRPLASYMCVSSFCVCMVFVFVCMFFSGLHYLMDMYESDILVGSGICLASQVCSGEKWAFVMFV